MVGHAGVLAERGKVPSETAERGPIGQENREVVET
jgi:hypothetical protein